ncbi:hypothetical protein NCS52_01573700 [Fusarium sp. LHS14.1]|nr:hypothetical protein NCS52_01573700 [Fusarium sp. LHS14.1]
MSDTIPPRSDVDRNIASEEENSTGDFFFNEPNFFGTPSSTELAVDQYFDRLVARNERSESGEGLEDLTSQDTALPLVAIREWNYNSSGSLLFDAGPVSMDTGFSIVNVPDQQTVDPLIQAGNRASTGVSIQTEHPKRLRDTGVDLIELFNNASCTAYDDLGAPARAYPNTVDLECYGDVDISPDTTLELAEFKKVWFEKWIIANVIFKPPGARQHGLV